MHTIFGGNTLNNIEIADMVDNNKDYVYRNEELSDKLFVRCNTTGAYNDEGKLTPLPELAMVVYHEDEPYDPLYAKMLESPYTGYLDDWGYGTEKLNDAIKDFWGEVKDNYDAIMAEYQKRAEKSVNNDIPDTVDGEYDEPSGDDKEFE